MVNCSTVLLSNVINQLFSKNTVKLEGNNKIALVATFESIFARHERILSGDSVSNCSLIAKMYAVGFFLSIYRFLQQVCVSPYCRIRASFQCRNFFFPTMVCFVCSNYRHAISKFIKCELLF